MTIFENYVAFLFENQKIFINFSKRPKIFLFQMKFTGFLVWIFYFMVFWSSVDAEFFDELPKILKQKCAVLIFEPVSNELQSVIEKLIALEPLASEIFFDSIQLKTLISQKFLHFKSGISGISDHSKPGVSGISDPGQDPEKSKSEFLVLPKVLEDRSCLLKPNLRHLNLKAEFYNGPITVESVLEFINAHCLTYFAPDGSLSFSGQKRNFLLANLFEISQLNNSVKMEEISENCGPDLAGFWFSGCCETSEFRNPKISKFKNQEYAEFKNPEISEFQCAKFEIPRCEEIWQIPTKQEFLDNFLSRSKPVVIRNAAADWRILKIWTNEFFRRKFGDREVHVKLTPNGEFEGVEPLALWNYDGFHIPNEVKNQLKFPDLVMARPAGLEMRFSEFLDFIESPKKNFSAYLEYSTIKEYFAELLEEVSEFPFIKGLLKLDYLNIWLSDGNTLGKLHFDQYDNFLVQVCDID